MCGFAASLLKTVTTGLSPVGKQANRPAGEKSAPPCPLRGTSPKGKRVTGFSVALRLLTNPVPLPPRKRWQNKAPRNNYLISGTKHSTGCCAPAQRGKCGAVKHQRGEKPPEVANQRKAVLADESKGNNRNAAFPPNRYLPPITANSPRTKILRCRSE